METGAWFVLLLASFGWAGSWLSCIDEEYASSEKPAANRGCTLDDPDVIAIVTNLVMNGIFFILNANILLENMDLRTATSNLMDLVALGDTLFIFNAWMYLIASLRDCDCLWFMPHWGRLKSLDEIILVDKEVQLGLPTSPSSGWLFDRNRSWDSINSDSSMEEMGEREIVSSRDNLVKSAIGCIGRSSSGESVSRAEERTGR